MGKVTRPKAAAGLLSISLSSTQAAAIYGPATIEAANDVLVIGQ